MVKRETGKLSRSRWARLRPVGPSTRLPNFRLWGTRISADHTLLEFSDEIGPIWPVMFCDRRAPPRLGFSARLTIDEALNRARDSLASLRSRRTSVFHPLRTYTERQSSRSVYCQLSN